MVKKDFTSLNTDKNDISSVTSNYLSQYTLGKVTEPEEPKETKTTQPESKNKKNKEKYIGLRVTEEFLEKVLERVKETGSETVSRYLMQLIKEDIKK